MFVLLDHHKLLHGSKTSGKEITAFKHLRVQTPHTRWHILLRLRLALTIVANARKEANAVSGLGTRLMPLVVWE